MNNEKVFAINPGETELEGLLRTTKIMKKQLDWFTPRSIDSLEKSLLEYHLIRHYLKMYDEISQKDLMMYLLKYPGVGELRTRIQKISETVHYKACMVLLDAGAFMHTGPDALALK